MQVNIKNAVSRFYPKPSFEQVYFESVANAIDAGATWISVLVKIDAFDLAKTLSVTIKDNGEGFTDRNFEKFCSLFEVDNSEHRGLGRLVYLAYFDEIEVISRYKGRSRSFVFTSDFLGESTVTDADSEDSGTTLVFQRFSNRKIHTYDYLKPSYIKKELIAHFLPILFSKKQAKDEFRIDLELQADKKNRDHDFFPDTQTLELSDIPKFKEKTFREPPLDLFQDFKIYHSVARDQSRPKSILSAICVDGRVVPYDLLSPDSIPEWYQVSFLFVSGYFQGKTDPSRRRLELPDSVSEKAVKRTLRREVGRILSEEIRDLGNRNKKTKEDLDRQYPHLHGYFPEETVGLIVANDVIKEAQERFLADQKKTLECAQLSDADYEKALAVSARVLLEYILYRTRIIAKLESMNTENSEAEIHNLIVPRRRTLKRNDFASDVFNNNVWMLDDKYMSYATILSDEEMKKVMKEISIDGEPTEGKPDITLVFSADPQKAGKVDVVVVELKKHGVDLAKKEEAESQLRQRARRLLKCYPDKIERIWFYGITDIDDEFKRSLKEHGYKELFSHGNMLYNAQPIYVDGISEPFPVDMYIMTYETFIEDAKSRNSTFLSILKESIRKSSGGILDETEGEVESPPELTDETKETAELSKG